MEGIPSGLTSVTQILPETMLIPEKGGAKGPPVEIAPLPDNNFSSDSATAEMLNNPFTLSLDKRGYADDGADGRLTIKTAVSTGKGPLTEDPVNETMLNTAYKLDLSSDTNQPVTSQMARELSLMKNYEMLGRAYARRSNRLNPETGPAGQRPSSADVGKANLTFNISVKNILGNATAGQTGLYTETAETGGAGQAPAQAGNMPPKSAQIPLQSAPLQSSQTQQAPLSAPLAYQLTPSDYEMILTLEPDLQEALLNMLGSGITLPKQNIAAGGTVPETGSTPGSSVGAADIHQPEAGSISAMLERMGASLQDGISAPPAPNLPLSAGTVSGFAGAAAQPALSSDATIFSQSADGSPRLISGVLSDIAARTALPAGNMANLQKITELPYALYVFGSAVPEKHESAEADDGMSVTDRPRNRPLEPSEFLKLSEAVKMAAVLHNIYHGGSGFFPQAMPWYAPYVQYAIKHGIIRSGEFDDYNEFATRAETAYIFSNCVPLAEFPVINAVTKLSDTEEDTGYGEAVYRLWRSGVLIMNDRQGRFFPERMITRSEAAGLIGRIATPADRKKTQ